MLNYNYTSLTKQEIKDGNFVMLVKPKKWLWGIFVTVFVGAIVGMIFVDWRIFLAVVLITVIDLCCFVRYPQRICSGLGINEKGVFCAGKFYRWEDLTVAYCAPFSIVYNAYPNRSMRIYARYNTEYGVVSSSFGILYAHRIAFLPKGFDAKPANFAKLGQCILNVDLVKNAHVVAKYCPNTIEDMIVTNLDFSKFKELIVVHNLMVRGENVSEFLDGETEQKC